ncbi:phenylalanine--tRNA ligase subunit beta [Salinisphaera sp. T31B1]|uniref:phenylalanine--tRNA ligase subunit beta n=1 Tax=Salinisphaera sp. T31B1 TaxID=727963 RepID=UPI003342909A
MKMSERWLRSWVDTPDDIDTLADRLTMAGLEVDDITPAGPSLDGIVVGRVVTCEPHPDADKLRVCEVDVGAERLNIVCGAPNVGPGIHAPVATVGAVMPGGMKIKAAKLRGVASRGMLCSASELGMASDADGLWLLPVDAPVGQPLADYLGLPDQVLEVDLTPNRGDCLSVRGLAREVAVTSGQVLAEPATDLPEVTGSTLRPVQIAAPADCVGYAAQCVTGIDPGACTPMWMRERLRRAGIRTINLPVDIGNYVMLELGQPMHAFDGDRLTGDIQVRRARSNEKITTLDGEEVVLDVDTLVIADDEGAVAIAGMIGGQRTAVDEQTVNVVFEAACFTPTVVAGRGRKYKIQTDSLHRFERGVDPSLHPRALARATALLIDLAGGSVGPVSVEQGQPMWPATRRIDLDETHITRLLGQPIDAAWVGSALEWLGMDVEFVTAGRWTVVPPSWRFDINIEADLIEEVARVYGYDQLAAEDARVRLPAVSAAAAGAEPERVACVLRERGYSEAITYSFVEPGLHAMLTDDATAVTLDNPISDLYVQMRRTLWASLLPSWHYNVRRQQARVRLYERGLRFLPDENAEAGVLQSDTLAGVVGGLAEDPHWDRTTRPVDFFDVKGDVEALFAGSADRPRFVAATHPALHPGRTARIEQNGIAVGWLGQLAPVFRKRFKNIELPYVFELDYDAVARSTTPRFEPVSEQPLVRRDLALVVDESVPVGRLVEAVESLELVELQQVQVFDLFRGQGLETGFKSVALSLIFQDKASTLTDEGVETIITRVVSVLEQRCGARIRGE